MRKIFLNQSGLATVVIAAIVAVVAAAGASGWYFFVRDDPGTGVETTTTSSEMTAEPATTGEEAGDSSFSGSYFDAIDRGRPLECDWRVPENLAGEFQVGQGKFYTDGVSRGYSMGTFQNEGVKVTAHSIFNEDGVFYWSEIPGAPTMGFKISKAELEASESEMSEAEKQQGREYRADYSFSCQPWTVDEDLLEVPPDVRFRDIPAGGDSL